MKLPYGISDFKALREQGYSYIDKTRYIELLESMSSKYVFFIRPRRFGKSLFLSMLEYYYDINSLTNFDSLYGNLYIGKKPTPLKNSYMVLQFDFSALNTDSRETLQKSFNVKLISSIKSFLRKYEKCFANISLIEEAIADVSDAGSIFTSFIDIVKDIGKKIYLIIDEYDHFANDIIAMGENEFYKDIVRTSGFVRDFYESVKIGTKSIIDRIFITGSSPVMLDDLTSGFNIAKNLTTNVALNEMLGFTEDDVRQIVDKAEIDRDKTQLMRELKKYYNGYLFNVNGKERMYNPDMVLHFFTEYQISGYYPEQLIDDNVKTDYGKLERLVGNEENRNTLEEIIKNEGIATNIATKFSFDRMYDSEYFVSLLFYMGVLTIKGKGQGTTEFVVPNYVIREIFWGYFEKTLKAKYNMKYNSGEVAKTIWQMGYKGNIYPFIDFVSGNVLKALSNRDLINFDERYIKLVIFSYIKLANIYNPVSEKEVENGYIDIYLERDARMPDAKYEWIIELKYIKKSEAQDIEKVKEEGLKQLEKYGQSIGMRDRQDVRKALIIFIGKDECLVIERD